jgi:hypothetical protein
MRRLYLSGKLSLDDIKTRLADGKITTAEYDYIVGIAQQAGA